MVGVDIHPPARNHPETVGREAQVPLGGARHPGGNLRRSDLPAHLQHGAHAVSARGGQGVEGKLGYIEHILKS